MFRIRFLSTPSGKSGLYALVAGAALFFMSPVASGQTFIRGDSNGDGRVDLADAITTLGCMFRGNACALCEDAMDSNDDGAIDIGEDCVLLARKSP